MDKKDITNIASRAGSYFKNAIADAKVEHEEDLYNAGYDEGITVQKEYDINCAIKAFFDLKIKEHEIYRLLSTYFGVDSVAKAREYIKKTKIDIKLNELMKYCRENGMSSSEFGKYIRHHKLAEKLFADESLLKMQPDKLKAIIDEE